MRKRGKDKDKGKELGVITDFMNHDSDEGDENTKKLKQFSNGFYIYIGSRQQYGIIRQKKSDTQYVVKVRNPKTQE